MRRQQRVRGGRRHHLVLQMCQFRWSSRGWGLRWAPSHHGAGRFSAGVSGKICSCLLRSYLSPIFPHNLSYNFFYNFYKCHPQAVSERNLQSCLFHQRFSTNLHKCHCKVWPLTKFSHNFPQIFTNCTQLVSELWEMVGSFLREEDLWRGISPCWRYCASSQLKLWSKCEEQCDFGRENLAMAGRMAIYCSRRATCISLCFVMNDWILSIEFGNIHKPPNCIVQ